jgi:hypothetical protein
VILKFNLGETNMSQQNINYDKDCQICPYFNQTHLNILYKTIRTSPPVGLEDNGSDTLLVFQSPGVNEWHVNGGHPLKATPRSAGKRIELSWERVRKQRNTSQTPIRTNYDIINVVQCFQGKAASGRDAKPLANMSQKINQLRLGNQKNPPQ